MSSRDQVKASHILIKHQGSRRKASWKDPEGKVIMTTTREAAVEQLKSIREDIVSGKANFEDVAARVSDCSSAKRGGDLGLPMFKVSCLMYLSAHKGPFGRGQMQKPFEEATYALKVGDISEIVDTDSGTRSVRVENVSDLATEREIHEFFSFSGDIDHIEILKDASEQSRLAFVTFTEPKALEIALLLSGATIVDKIVTITPAENYVPRRETMQQVVENTIPPTPTRQTADGSGGRAYVSKAQDVMATVLAKGSALGQDAVNKAKAFDELHQLRANASAKVSSFDKRVRLSEKFNVGISVVNEKVKSVDQRLQVSDKTMAAIFAAEKKLNDTGSAVKSSRYVTAGAAWFSGAFSKVARAGQLAGSKTKEKFNLAVSNIASKDTPIAV
ncbi:hypothetical protein IGI04_025823 [Brassica rapa subsp. trilocularis]|uniref:Peptidylprolyl isomerase n=1 Tax=Brassica rapa subsp. trilocularis TaxID=1813537 RepID=A0ABQ7KWT3_BRACM|nr:hypothetical protein IGI04_025823 [Brassica rapa subsp. trilocularis]